MVKFSNKLKNPYFWGHAEFQKKLMSQSQENSGQKDGRTDRQILIHRTLPVTAWGPKCKYFRLC